MAIDAETVCKVAALARIGIEDERLEPMARELSGIMAWIEQLAEVDTQGVEPMTSAVARALPMREDVVTEAGDAAAILANAPRTEKGFFVVPKVVE
ncbi:MAG: Asp-tRNA(Asn)/Glu-tRNA(Gln) amidotransferase subunit GatC [Caulobacteraceae bacterium]